MNTTAAHKKTDRLTRLQQKLTGVRLIGAGSDIRYLTGFTGSDSLLAVSERDAVLITDGRYTLQAQSELIAGCRLHTRSGSFAEAVSADGIAGPDVSQTGLKVSEEGMDLALFTALQRGFDKHGIALCPVPSPVTELRIVKDRSEIKKIEAALRLTEEAFIYITASLKPGMTERQVAAKLEYYCRIKGAERASFEFIVAAGERGALPHGVASDREIRKDETVLFDFGIVLDGYCSDFTRVVYTGRKLPAEVKRAWELTAEAQQTGFESLAPGVDVRVPDDAVFRLFQSRKQAAYYTHSLGHGVGLDIHEQPRLSRKADPMTLRPGMVVTVEPGLYYPGKFGIRLEDMIEITRNGARRLTDFPLDIPCLDL